MRATLHALTEELRRLQTMGVKTVSVSDESIASLRRVIRARSAGSVETAGSSRATQTSSAPADPIAPSWQPQAARAVAKVAKPSASLLPPPPTITLPVGEKQERWDAVLAAVKSDPVCAKQLRPGKQVVLGVGSLDAKLFFCGEAPGSEEETQGEPFVGPAGQLLTKMIQGMGLKREEVYIGNIMNWRPQLPTVDGVEQLGNRPPTTEEMAYCLPYLRAQLEIVQPDVIIALGSTAAKGLLGDDSFKTLGEIRGKWQEFGSKPVMVTYHPSYILRNQSNRSKRMIWDDLLQVMERVQLPISEKQRGYFLTR